MRVADTWRRHLLQTAAADGSGTGAGAAVLTCPDAPSPHIHTQALLSSPQPDDPQDAVVARQYLSEFSTFEKTAR